MTGIERFYEYITAFGAGVAFTSATFAVAFSAWVIGIVLLGATAFLTYAFHCPLQSDMDHSEEHDD